MKTKVSSWFWFIIGGAALGFLLWRRLLPRPLEVHTLVCDAPAGADIEEAARHACELANDEVPFRVEFEFNGVRLVVNPGVKPEHVVKAYNAAMEAKAKAAAEPAAA